MQAVYRARCCACRTDGDRPLDRTLSIKAARGYNDQQRLVVEGSMQCFYSARGDAKDNSQNDHLVLDTQSVRSLSLIDKYAREETKTGRPGHCTGPRDADQT